MAARKLVRMRERQMFDLRHELERFITTVNDRMEQGKFPNGPMMAFPEVARLLWEMDGCRERPALIDSEPARSATIDFLEENLGKIIRGL